MSFRDPVDTPGPRADLAPLVLPRLVIRRLLPTAALRPWVDHYWFVQGPPPDAPTRNKLYPDGGTTLTFRRLDTTSPTAGWDITCRPVAAYTTTVGASLGIRFRPGGAFQLFGMSLEALSDDDLWERFAPDDWLALRDELPALPLEERLARLDAWLLARAEANGPRIGHVQRLLPLIDSGRFTIDRVVAHHGLSRRTLERTFRHQVGLAPAQMDLLQRLKHARALLARAESSLSQVALACGFHDQAHFTHRFRRHAGETPGEYRQRKLTQIYKA
ncbi:helix-turn-helix transcriptional regulator [Halomonas caseinilytica]|uniref:Transcriptional regulator, AraC family n=1 Tax=Halomonas caseinilytica TaxID=438744 RepID=A0A1M6NF65_9GAMM|nr:helix-turn-helix transcriptional regulator [Halomonas caseinilytica]SHJ94263.1 transcriptional regulator, AraC family [Halomonas caseinilytica]